MVYCATQRLMEKSCVFCRNYYIKALDHKSLWFIGMINTWGVGKTLDEFVNHERQASDLGIRLVLYQHPA